MAILCAYIDDEAFQQILCDLNIVGKSDDQQQDLLDRAVGYMEADLCERFVVPLTAKAGLPYELAPQFSRNMVKNMIKAKIRQLLGLDLNRNLVIDSTQKFVDTMGIEYANCKKILLDSRKNFAFLLQDQAQDALEPVQHIGVARADNEPYLENDLPWR